MELAQTLEKHWNEARGAEKHGRMDGLMVKYCTNSLPDTFERFEQLTGLNEAEVVGMFNRWNLLPHSEAEELRIRLGVANGFCAYMAEQVERRSSGIPEILGEDQ